MLDLLCGQLFSASLNRNKASQIAFASQIARASQIASMLPELDQSVFDIASFSGISNLRCTMFVWKSKVSKVGREKERETDEQM